MEYIKVCQYCGRTFTARKPNAKYCGDICRTNAFKSTARANARAEREREEEKTDAQFRQECEIRRKQRDKEEQDRAAAGDPLARMLTVKRYSLEYWQAYQEYLLQIEPNSQGTVCGIPVTNPDFPALVVTAIEELGVIQTKG